MPVGRVLRSLLEVALTAGAASLGLLFLLAAYSRLSAPLAEMDALPAPARTTSVAAIAPLSHAPERRRRVAGALRRPMANARQKQPERLSVRTPGPIAALMHPRAAVVIQRPQARAVVQNRKAMVERHQATPARHGRAMTLPAPRRSTTVVPPRRPITTSAVERVAQVPAPVHASPSRARIRRPQVIATPEPPVGFDTRPTLVSVPDAATGLAPDDTTLTLRGKHAH